jgi:hypothetical protein
MFIHPFAETNSEWTQETVEVGDTVITFDDFANLSKPTPTSNRTLNGYRVQSDLDLYYTCDGTDPDTGTGAIWLADYPCDIGVGQFKNMRWHFNTSTTQLTAIPVHIPIR